MKSSSLIQVSLNNWTPVIEKGHWLLGILDSGRHGVKEPMKIK